MIFKQKEDGSCDIEFSWKERFIILKKGKLHFSDEMLRHFGNNLVRMVSDWNLRFRDDIKNKNTYDNTRIEGK
jgi:hypothetical protein